MKEKKIHNIKSYYSYYLKICLILINYLAFIFCLKTKIYCLYDDKIIGLQLEVIKNLWPSIVYLMLKNCFCFYKF